MRPFERSQIRGILGFGDIWDLGLLADIGELPHLWDLANILQSVISVLISVTLGI